MREYHKIHTTIGNCPACHHKASGHSAKGCEVKTCPCECDEKEATRVMRSKLKCEEQARHRDVLPALRTLVPGIDFEFHCFGIITDERVDTEPKKLNASLQVPVPDWMSNYIAPKPVHRAYIPFASGLVAPGESTWVTVHPQFIFASIALLQIEELRCFEIMAVRIGVQPQALPQQMHGRTLVRFNTCQISQDFAVLIKNNSTEPRAWGAVVEGLGVP